MWVFDAAPLIYLAKIDQLTHLVIIDSDRRGRFVPLSVRWHL
jgi:hypothetical protein